MSRKQSVQSTKRHRMVHNWLVKKFPGCEVYSNGVEGLDHIIVFNGNPMYIETKTCSRIIKGNIRRIKGRPIVFHDPRLGKFKFDKIKKYPYEISQHHDLVKYKGWYIFVVGNKIMGGLPAKDIKLTDTKNEQRISWINVTNQCYPDWLRRLKLEVYGI